MRHALVVVAHPDDVDFQAAGTVASWVRAGVEVAYCVLTDGDAGQSAESRDRVGEARRAEQRAAAAVLGVRDVRFLGYPDGRLEVSVALRRDISRVIREVRPDRVLLQSPEFHWDWVPDTHPDHRAAGEAAWCAVYPDARNPHAHPEIADLAPWTVPETWVVGGPTPDHFVDVTGFVDLKVAALRAHGSQTGHLADLDGHVRSRLAGHARRGGLPDGVLAEAFQVVTTGPAAKEDG
ncbi:PIG-L deacetylase family protein [Longispora fulva]|uniref:PIG-L deacetylase family protein n=1 Tax=Longispora fulva TaxID=619741 RepID=UPI0018C9F78C|nr:PIG-L deacetylase family protein [Longispora fulva]